MNRYKSAVVAFFVSGIIGCASIPPELKDTGATLLEECPKNMDISVSNDHGAILTSIVIHTHDRNTWYFLLKEESTRSKYLMKLEPGQLGLDGIHKEGVLSFKSPSQSHCYVIQPGRYQFVKAFAYRYIGRSSQTSSAPRLFEYDYRQGFQVDAGKVAYIGQLFVEDPRIKGKGYFGHVSALASELPDALFFRRDVWEVEISSIDELNDDVTWLERNTQTTRASVVNMADF
jgi:hypothetical protein